MSDTYFLRINGKLTKFNDTILTRTTGGGGGNYPTNNLWALWRFDGNVEDSYDSNDLGGGAISYPAGGYPESFDYSGRFGSGGYSYITDDIFKVDENNALSISVWFKATSTATGNIFATAGNVYLRNGFQLVFNGNGTMTYGISKSGVGGNFKTISYTEDQWNHLVFTVYNDEELRYAVYLNNDLKDGGSYSNTADMYNIFHIGVTSDPGHHSPGWLNGCDLASMFVYTEILSESEVSQLYNSGSGV